MGSERYDDEDENYDDEDDTGIDPRMLQAKKTFRRTYRGDDRKRNRNFKPTRQNKHIE
jgi:hypothetical protein